VKPIDDDDDDGDDCDCDVIEAANFESELPHI